MRQVYFVPVRESEAGTLALRTGRLVSGERVGLAFTSEASLQLTLGPVQQWVRLDAAPLHDMLAPLGIGRIRIDPRPVVPEPVPAPGQVHRQTTRHRGRNRRRHRSRSRRHAAHGSRRRPPGE